MKVKLILKTDLGEFESNTMNLSEEQFRNLNEMSRSFYGSGFEMLLENGFLVAAPEIVRRSILIVKILEEENGNQEKI